MNRLLVVRVASFACRMKGLPTAGLAFCCVFSACGCGTTRPIARWQGKLTKFIVEHGNGDPSILRDSAELRSPNALRPGQIRFSEIGIPAPGIPPFVTTRDVHGVLVGQENDTFFFLVGVVRRPFSGASKVEDIRLAGAKLAGSVHQWRLSEPNRVTLEEYATAKGAPEHGYLRSGLYESFPHLDDDFQLEFRKGQAIASDSRSGAIWKLSLHPHTVARR